jgi:predicted nuclease of predicted toxin-antitoxin system
MKLLLDHCVPKRLEREFKGHLVRTAFQMGWADLDNGDLLAAAATNQFGAFITVDQNIRYQRHLAKLPLPVLTLIANDNKLATLQPYIPLVLKVLSGPLNQALFRIHGDGRVEVVASKT